MAVVEETIVAKVVGGGGGGGGDGGGGEPVLGGLAGVDVGGADELVVLGGAEDGAAELPPGEDVEPPTHISVSEVE